MRPGSSRVKVTDSGFSVTTVTSAGGGAALPAAAGAGHFTPTPFSFLPPNSTGVLWTQGHTSVSFAGFALGVAIAAPIYAVRRWPEAFSAGMTAKTSSG